VFGSDDLAAASARPTQARMPSSERSLVLAPPTRCPKAAVTPSPWSRLRTCWMMLLLAKRAAVWTPAPTETSTWSAEAKDRAFSVRARALSSFTMLPAFRMAFPLAALSHDAGCRSHLHIAHSNRRGAVGHLGDLHGVALAAVEDAAHVPEPLVGDGVD